MTFLKELSEIEMHFGEVVAVDSLLNFVYEVVKSHSPMPLYQEMSGECRHGNACEGVLLNGVFFCPDSARYVCSTCSWENADTEEVPYPCRNISMPIAAFMNSDVDDDDFGDAALSFADSILQTAEIISTKICDQHDEGMWDRA